MRGVPWLSLLVLTALVLPLAGCYNTMWWDYRDDPYMADLGKRSDGDVLRNVNSPKAPQRQVALRVLAHRAAQARAEGRLDKARELETVIVRRYLVEKDEDVRAAIVRICAPAAGRGSTAMVKFLRERIAAGEFPGYAALSLAALGPRGAFEDIEPLTRHPAPEVRLRAAEALIILGDPRGLDAVTRVWQAMQPGMWPDRIDGIPFEEVKAGIEMRAIRVFGQSVGR